MPLTGSVPLHPAEFSDEVLDVCEPIVCALAPTRVHDPFAGRGVRLGALCDRLGITFSGTDIEQYADADPRVRLGDSTDAGTYPAGGFVVVTSPVYLNRISTDYVNGPTRDTKRSGRRAYGISLGRALDRNNLARLCRPRQRHEHYARTARVVKHWHEHAIVNVDLPMRDDWCSLLAAHGYCVDVVRDAYTRRYRGPANSDKRADHEVVIVATRKELRDDRAR